MQNSILALIAVSLAIVTVPAAECISASSTSDSFGFSSEDWGSGSYLGVDTRDIAPDRLSDLRLKEERGVEITMVDQDAPAGKAGLKERDVILTLNGENVQSVEQLRRMIREIPPGRTVTLGISRDGQPMTIKVTLADRKDSFSNSFSRNAAELADKARQLKDFTLDLDIPSSMVVVHSSARSGLAVENLTPQLSEFFGAKNGNGVLVRSVEKGSRAEKAGFRAGDVIIKVNGETIHDTGDFTHALRSRKDSNVSVGILRDRKEQTVTMALPERPQSEVLQESVEIPDVAAEVQMELSDLRSEIAQVTPEIAKEVQNQVKQLKPVIAQATRNAARQKCHVQQEIRKQMLEMQREMENERPEIERELREELVEDDTRI
jgi:membrane-associated protease RseP (regulator of RpoE activity)